MRRFHAWRERGQNQLEYVGLVVLVAAVVVGIASSSVGGKLVGGFKSAICQITDPDSRKCVSLRGPVDGLTPLEKATSGNYVALGDSYSSGEGGSEFEPGTDEDPSLTDSAKESVDGWIPWYDHTNPPSNLCHRSTKAYSQRIYDEYAFEGDFGFHACSGATIEDLYTDDTHANAGEIPQLENLDEDTSLVTLSIGGNDVGFADVVEECLTKGILEWQDGCRETMGEETVKKIRDLKDDLVKLYDEMQRRAPNARILIVGYPRMFPDEPGVPGLEVGPSLDTGDLDEPIEPADQRWMNDMGQLLNQTIKAAAEEAGVEYVDVSDALDGHEIGTEDSWINDLNFEWENGKPVDMGSFHPNDEGQAAIARLVQQRIKNGG